MQEREDLRSPFLAGDESSDDERDREHRQYVLDADAVPLENVESFGAGRIDGHNREKHKRWQFERGPDWLVRALLLWPVIGFGIDLFTSYVVVNETSASMCLYGSLTRIALALVCIASRPSFKHKSLSRSAVWLGALCGSYFSAIAIGSTLLTQYLLQMTLTVHKPWIVVVFVIAVGAPGALLVWWYPTDSGAYRGGVVAGITTGLVVGIIHNVRIGITAGVLGGWTILTITGFMYWLSRNPTYAFAVCNTVLALSKMVGSLIALALGKSYNGITSTKYFAPRTENYSASLAMALLQAVVTVLLTAVAVRRVDRYMLELQQTGVDAERSAHSKSKNDVTDTAWHPLLYTSSHWSAQLLTFRLQLIILGGGNAVATLCSNLWGTSLGDERTASIYEAIIWSTIMAATWLETQSWRSCPNFRQCHEYLQSLGIDKKYFDVSHNRCLCSRPKCAGSIRTLDFPPVRVRGYKPARKYHIPYGWCRFGLAVDEVKASSLKVFRDWNTCFHGTMPNALPSIISHQQLLIPGDTDLYGTPLNIREGHVPGQVFIYTTPSIRYASTDYYATPVPLDERLPGGPKVQVVLQCLQFPQSVAEQAETIGQELKHPGVPVDPYFDNAHIEWFTKRRVAIMITGVLVRVQYHQGLQGDGDVLSTAQDNVKGKVS